MTRPSRIFLAALLAVVGFAGIANAQAVFGTIVGSVTDPSGARVVGATVTILDMDRNVSTVTTTNESGNFRQGFLIVGRYQIKIERPGFRTYVRSNVNVSVDTETTVDIPLELGNTNQTVEVTAQGEVLKTERSDVAITFSQKQVQDLPSIGRRFSNFELITPGVTQTA